MGEHGQVVFLDAMKAPFKTPNFSFVLTTHFMLTIVVVIVVKDNSSQKKHISLKFALKFNFNIQQDRKTVIINS